MIPYLWPKQPKNHTLWARTYLYNPYKGVSPPVETTAILRICLHAPAVTHIKILSATHAQTKCLYAVLLNANITKCDAPLLSFRYTSSAWYKVIPQYLYYSKVQLLGKYSANLMEDVPLPQENEDGAVIINDVKVIFVFVCFLLKQVPVHFNFKHASNACHWCSSPQPIRFLTSNIYPIMKTAWSSYIKDFDQWYQKVKIGQTICVLQSGATLHTVEAPLMETLGGRPFFRAPRVSAYESFNCISAKTSLFSDIFTLLWSQIEIPGWLLNNGNL